MKWDIFKYIFQILRALLTVARMTVFLRAEDLQRALHTFQSGQNYLDIFEVKTVNLVVQQIFSFKMKICFSLLSFTLTN